MSGDDFTRVFGTKPVGRGAFAAHVASTAVQQRREGKAEAVETAAYKPYGVLPTDSITETCEVVRWIEGTEIPEGIDFPYRFLIQVGFVGEEQLKLFLPDCIVVIEGRNLRDLRKKLARRQVTFIQQWSPRVWPAVPPAGEPVVEKIAVARPESMPRKNG
jgi:hypothetical protein